MKSSRKSNGYGIFSLGWLAGGYALLSGLSHYDFRLQWILGLATVLAWFSIGVVSAGIGLVRGSLLGRICSLVAVGILVLIFWQMMTQSASPKGTRPKHLPEPMPVGAVHVTSRRWLSFFR